MPVQRPYNPNGKRMAEMMQADLAKIGVNAKLVTYEWGEYRKRLQAGEHMTGLLGWTGDNGDPGQFLLPARLRRRRQGGQNLSKWCNKDFDDLLVKARDPDRQGRAHQALREDAEDRARGGAVRSPSPIRSCSSRSARMSRTTRSSPLGRHEFYGVDLN